MKTKIIFGILAATLMLGLVISVFIPAQVVLAAAPQRRGGPGNAGGSGSAGFSGAAAGAAATPLTADEAAALQDAIREEYGALNLYSAVQDQFGSIYPFSQITRSEQQHVNVLVRQAEKYGVEIPVNTGLSDPVKFDTLAAACQAGVAAEIADAKLYDELEKVTTHTDLLQVYANLQSASLNNHLPAFQTCD